MKRILLYFFTMGYILSLGISQILTMVGFLDGTPIIIGATILYFTILTILIIVWTYKPVKNQKGNFTNVNIVDKVEELYETLYNNYVVTLKKQKNKCKMYIVITTILFIGLMALLIYIGKNTATLPVVYIVFILALCAVTTFVAVKMMENRDVYKKQYKKEIISKFIHLINPGLNYIIEDTENSLKEKYKDSEFDKNNYTYIISDDYIKGNLEDNTDIEIGELIVQKTTKFGTSRETTNIFKGMFVYSKLKDNSLGIIKICKNKINFEKNKVELDDAEFEKYFDVTAKDRIQATRLLTADIMKIMIDFYKNVGIAYEITIKENKLYLRFYTKSMFEPKIWGKALDKEQIYTYYNTLKFIIEVTEKLNYIIGQIEL